MSQGKNILVVDDDLMIVRGVKLFAERAGYRVTISEDGLDAWNKATDQHFDLVLSDYRMPFIDGIELCRRLRFDPSYQATPLVVMSAFHQELDIETVVDELRITVLQKPLNFIELVETIERLLAALPLKACRADETLPNLS